MADPPNVTEAFFLEWVNFGLAEIALYLSNWARFEVWCRNHNRL